MTATEAFETCEEVAKLESTAGCGHGGSLLQALDPGDNRITRTPLNRALESAFASSLPVEIRSVGGRQYLLDRTEGQDLVESMNVSGAQRLCTIKYRRGYRVSPNR